VSAFLIAILLLTSFSVFGEGNQTISSISKAKRLLEKKVYIDRRETLYNAVVFFYKHDIWRAAIVFIHTAEPKTEDYSKIK
jgi:hypothetical protein